MRGCCQAHEQWLAAVAAMPENAMLPQLFDAYHLGVQQVICSVCITTLIGCEYWCVQWGCAAGKLDSIAAHFPPKTTKAWCLGDRDSVSGVLELSGHGAPSSSSSLLSLSFSLSLLL